MAKAGQDGTLNKDKLNRMMPAAARAKLGDCIDDLITQHNALLVALSAATYMVGSAGLAIKAGGGVLVKAANAFVALIENVAVGKVANTDMAALAGTIAAGKFALWAFFMDAAGVLTASAKTADSDTADAALALLPATPAHKVLIGYIVVENGTVADFIGNTTHLDVADVTVTYYNAATPAPFVPSLTIATLSAR